MEFPENYPTRCAYKWHRQAGKVAAEALRLARVDVEAGTRRYPNAAAASDFNPPAPDGARWVESCEAAGLRLVGFADKIEGSGVQHRGWLLDDEGYTGGEVFRGVVYRCGQHVYAAGYADPYNEGGARLVFSQSSHADADDAAAQAAREADSLAERCAEAERDYHRTDAARQRFEDTGEQVAELAETCRERCRMLRNDTRGHILISGASRAVLRGDNLRDVSTIRALRSERNNLRESFSTCDGWEG